MYFESKYAGKNIFSPAVSSFKALCWCITQPAKSGIKCNIDEFIFNLEGPVPVFKAKSRNTAWKKYIVANKLTVTNRRRNIVIIFSLYCSYRF